MGIGSIANGIIKVSTVGSSCSSSSAIFPPLIVVVAIVTALLMVCSWFVSSFLQGTSRLFVKWLPIVLLWVPVPVAPGVIFPSGIALVFFMGDQKGRGKNSGRRINRNLMLFCCVCSMGS